MDESKRQTGRTTRMLELAKRLSREGRAVYVVAANARQADSMRRWLGDEAGGIKVETESSIGNMDWETITLRGAHANCAVLVDHYAIECRFRKVLEELTRYDQ